MKYLCKIGIHNYKKIFNINNAHIISVCKWCSIGYINDGICTYICNKSQTEEFIKQHKILDNKEREISILKTAQGE